MQLVEQLTKIGFKSLSSSSSSSSLLSTHDATKATTTGNREQNQKWEGEGVLIVLTHKKRSHTFLCPRPEVVAVPSMTHPLDTTTHHLDTNEHNERKVVATTPNEHQHKAVVDAMTAGLESEEYDILTYLDRLCL